MGFEQEAAMRDAASCSSSGDQDGADRRRFPPAFADEISLVGPPERIRERLAVWRDSPVTTLMIHASEVDGLRTAAELVLDG
jgi:hypothetical protein